MKHYKHISFIMDGNRRYGKKINISEKSAYILGENKIYKIIKYLESNYEFEFISFWAFSKDNNKRQNWNCLEIIDQRELTNVEQVFQEFKCKVIGDIESLPSNIQFQINKFIKINEEIPSFKSNITIVFFINYSGSYDLEQTFKNLNNKENLNFENILENSLVKNIPQIDILIRTGGHQRLSNFSMFLLLYTELYFIKKLWPEFEIEDLEEILQYDKINRLCSMGS